MFSLVIVLFFTVLSMGRQTMLVRQDYAPPHTGWFHVPIKNNAKVENIMWCSELLPPQPGAVRLDLNDCHARGILKAQVFPGNSDFYRFDENENTVQISPQSIGGFWMNRQANIVLHGTVNDGKDDFEQIVRINPLTKLANGEETKMVEDHVPVQKPQLVSVPVVVSDNDKEKGNPGNGVSPPLPEEVEVEEETTNPSISPVVDGEEEEEKTTQGNPKTVLGLILGFGLIMMVGTIVFAVLRKKDSLRATAYSPSTVFQFENGHYKGLESDLRLAMEDDDVFVMIDSDSHREREYQEYLEDQSILSQMTSGK